MMVGELASRYAVVLAAVLVVAACSGQAPANPPASSIATSSIVGARTAATTTAPGTSNSPSATTAQSTPPAPTPPPKTTTADPVLARIPPAARPETAEAAAAYVAFYMHQLNEASKRADPQLLTNLASSGCKTCTAFRESIESLKQKGEHFAGDTLRINYSTPQVYSNEQRTVLIDVVQVAVPVVNSQGRTLRMTKPGKGAFVATVSFNRRWVIDRLQIAQQ